MLPCFSVVVPLQPRSRQSCRRQPGPQAVTVANMQLCSHSWNCTLAMVTDCAHCHAAPGTYLDSTRRGMTSSPILCLSLCFFLCFLFAFKRDPSFTSPVSFSSSVETSKSLRNKRQKLRNEKLSLSSPISRCDYLCLLWTPPRLFSGCRSEPSS